MGVGWFYVVFVRLAVLFSFVIRFQPLVARFFFRSTLRYSFSLPSFPFTPSCSVIIIHFVHASHLYITFLRFTHLSVFAGEFLRFVFCFCYAVGAMATQERARRGKLQ